MRGNPNVWRARLAWYAMGRWYVRLLAVLIVLAAAVSVARSEEILPGPVPARVVRVVDGDTIQVAARIWLGQEVTTAVRVIGVDTPELKGKCAAEREKAQAAKAFVEKLLPAGATVLLVDVRHDKYGDRVLAKVGLKDGAYLADVLIGEGLARPYAGDSRKPWCEEPKP